MKFGAVRNTETSAWTRRIVNARVMVVFTCYFPSMDLGISVEWLR